jgi:hypothetical protein
MQKSRQSLQIQVCALSLMQQWQVQQPVTGMLLVTIRPGPLRVPVKQFLLQWLWWMAGIHNGIG